MPELKRPDEDAGKQQERRNRFGIVSNDQGNLEQKKVINLKKEIGIEMSYSEMTKKKLIKCKHFPNCAKPADECPFVHPTELCKYFPACTMGDKCIYLHPEIECKFGVACTRQNCAYKHP